MRFCFSVVYSSWSDISVQHLKRTPVKRHHSAGDMLVDNINFRCSPPVQMRQRRPKSEGSFYVEGFKPKRASSFGVSVSETDISVAESFSQFF